MMLNDQNNAAFIFTKLTLVCVILVISSNSSFCQSIERQVISTYGGYAQQNTVAASYTVGEVSINTLSDATIVLTQGFQQAEDQIVNVRDNMHNIKFSVYPNPTFNTITIELTNTSNVEIKIYNAIGELLNLPFTSIQNNSSTLFQYDFSNLAAANYLLIVSDKSKKFSKSLNIFKTN